MEKSNPIEEAIRQKLSKKEEGTEQKSKHQEEKTDEHKRCPHCHKVISEKLTKGQK